MSAAEESKAPITGGQDFVGVGANAVFIKRGNTEIKEKG